MFLIELEKQEELTDTFLQFATTKYGIKVVNDEVEVWRTIKHLTDGEAEKVVDSVEKENGWQAWIKLNKRFEPDVAAKSSKAISELNIMTKTRAQSLVETRK